MYREPVALQGVSNRKTMPETKIVTTSTEEQLAQDESVHTFTGTVEGVGRGEHVSNREMQKAIALMLRQTRAGTTRVLSPARFQMLWDRLEATGLFTLPLYRGPEQPTDEPYFLVRSGKQSWIFKRPGLTRQLTAMPVKGTAPENVDPAIPLVKIWADAKIALYQFTNEE